MPDITASETSGRHDRRQAGDTTPEPASQRQEDKTGPHNWRYTFPFFKPQVRTPMLRCLGKTPTDLQRILWQRNTTLEAPRFSGAGVQHRGFLTTIWLWVKSRTKSSEHPYPHYKLKWWCTYPKMVPLVLTHTPYGRALCFPATPQVSTSLLCSFTVAAPLLPQRDSSRIPQSQGPCLRGFFGVESVHYFLVDVLVARIVISLLGALVPD